jgi:NADPH-ferrihemoprotein reductase
VDLDTGLCKGYVKAAFQALASHTDFASRFGFVQFYNFESCENCIRGFFYLGYQASFAQVLWIHAIQRLANADIAQKSRNSRLKDLEDRTSTNIYCTNIPITWTEAVSTVASSKPPSNVCSGPSSSFRAVPCCLRKDQPG